MGTRVPESPVSKEVAFSVLARDLDTARSPKEVLRHLNALYGGLCDPATAGNRARTFLLADGLPALIRHLGGTTTSDSTRLLKDMSSAIPDAAAKALTELLRNMDAATVGRIATTGVTSSLLDVLKSAPTVMGRSAATRGLLRIAEAQPAQHTLMADAGVVNLVLALYHKIGADPEVNWGDPFIRDTLDLGATLVRVLVRAKTTVVLQLRHSISASKSEGVWNSLVLLQVSLYPVLAMLACLQSRTLVSFPD